MSLVGVSASSSDNLGAQMQSSFAVNRGKMNTRPADYKVNTDEDDKLREQTPVVKMKCGIENTVNLPSYAYRGLKGDPDFNFFEYLNVCKIPYIVGGIGLIAACYAGRNNKLPSVIAGNREVLKRVSLGVLFYYIAKDLAKAAINLPVKLFRGVDLDMPYKNITHLAAGNPMNLPNNKKASNESVFDSTEFTRYDLLYNNKAKDNNIIFNAFAHDFGVKKSLNDSDSAVMPKMKSLMIMSKTWKYLLTVPFVTVALGLAQQDALLKSDLRAVVQDVKSLFGRGASNAPLKLNILSKDAWKNLAIGIKSNVLKPLYISAKELWSGYSVDGVEASAKQLAAKTSIFRKTFGKVALISAIALPIIANLLILKKTSLSDEVVNNTPGRNA